MTIIVTYLFVLNAISSTINPPQDNITLVERNAYVETDEYEGSGVITGTNRVLTCLHVVADPVSGMIKNVVVDGEPASVVKVDSKNDLVLLRVKTKRKYSRVKVATAKQGENVVVVGNPFDRRGVTFHGTITDVTEGESRTDVLFPSGISGGGVYNTRNYLLGAAMGEPIKGKLCGVITSIMDGFLLEVE